MADRKKIGWKKWFLLIVLLLLLLALLFWFRSGQGGEYWSNLLTGSPNLVEKQKQEARSDIAETAKVVYVEFYYQNDKFYLEDRLCSSLAKKIDEKILDEAVQELRKRYSGRKITVVYRKDRKIPVAEGDAGINLLEDRGLEVKR